MSSRNRKKGRGLALAAALLPVLFACDNDNAAPPPDKLCDDIPYQWATDATGRTGLTTKSVSGKIAVTAKERNGGCSIQNSDQDAILSFVVKLLDPTTAAAAAKDVDDYIAGGTGLPLAAAEGKGLVVSRQPDSDKMLRSYWVCSGVTLDISMKDARDEDQAAERLKTFTERLATLAPCTAPISTTG
jgi:hypothetical protein